VPVAKFYSIFSKEEEGILLLNDIDPMLILFLPALGKVVLKRHR
jgi:hypothetical protein